MRPSEPTVTVVVATRTPCVADESEPALICPPPSPWTVPWRPCSDCPGRLLEFVNRIRQALGIGSHVAPDIAIAAVAGELHGVVHPLLIGHFAQQRMAQDVRGDDEMLIGREMGIGLPGDAFQDQKRPHSIGFSGGACQALAESLLR